MSADRSRPISRRLWLALSLALATLAGVFAWHAAVGWYARPRPAAAVRASERAIFAIEFSPDGNSLAAAGADGQITLLEVPTAKTVGRIATHARPVYCLAFSSDGKRLASGGGDGIAEVWRSRTGERLAAIRGGSSITDICFCENGNHLAVRTIDGKAATLDLAGTEASKEACGGVCVQRLPQSRFTGRLLRSSADGRCVVEGFENGSVAVRDPSSSAITHRWAAHPDQVNSIALSPKGGQIATGGGYTLHPRFIAGGEPQVRVWSLADTGHFTRLTWHTEAVACVVFSPDGRWLASSDMVGWLCIWDVHALGDFEEALHEAGE